MQQIIKYPRTKHISGSCIQRGDEDLNTVAFESIAGRFMVVEEKVDGANSGISFDSNGKLYLQCRGHYLNGGYGERHFDLFKTWANCHQAALFRLLGSRYIMYGEWLYAKHTVFYDELTHYFMEFDIYDKEKKCFLSTRCRRELLAPYSFIQSVLVLFEGKISSFENLKSYLGISHFKSEAWELCLEETSKALGLDPVLIKQQTDPTRLMEGLYVKIENDDCVIERVKYVRHSFTNAILDSNTHWINRPIVPNKLKPGIDIYGE